MNSKSVLNRCGWKVGTGVLLQKEYLEIKSVYKLLYLNFVIFLLILNFEYCPLLSKTASCRSKGIEGS